MPPKGSKVGVRTGGRTRKPSQRAIQEEDASDSDDTGSSSSSDDEVKGGEGADMNQTWVQCDKCSKWRRLTGVADVDKLPKKWYCTMNNDPARNTCAAPEEEETEKDPDQRLKAHLRLWVRRLQCQDTAEVRLPAASSTRGKKRPLHEQEYIQCCDPNCGKWRALHRSLDSKTLAERAGAWYCVMNTWDEALASCSAPQELPLGYDRAGSPSGVVDDEPSGHSKKKVRR